MKRVVLLILTLTLVMIGASGCGNSTTESADKAPEQSSASDSAVKETLEYKLASINAGYKVDTDDPTIVQFKTYLDGIVAGTGDTPTEVSDALVYTHNRTSEAGKPDTLLDIAAGVNKVASAGGGVSVNEICASMLTLMGV